MFEIGIKVSRHCAFPGTAFRRSILAGLVGLLVLLCHPNATSADVELKGDLGLFEDRCLQLVKESNYFEGMKAAAQFVDRAQQLRGENDDATATAVHFLAFFHQLAGDLESAEKLWQRALTIDEALHGKESLATTRRLNMMGGLYRTKGDFPKARSYLSRALAIRMRELGPDHILTGYVLYELGQLEAMVGEFNAAEDCFSRTIAIAEKLSDDRHLLGWKSSIALGWLYQSISDTDGAERCVEKALRLGKTLPDPLATSSDLVARVYRARGDIARAEKTLLQRLEVLEGSAATGDQHGEAIWSTRQGLADLYLNEGDLARAQRVFGPPVLAMPDGVPLPLTKQFEGLLLWAQLEERGGNYAAAEKFVLQACALFDVKPGPYLNGLCGALRDLIRVQFAMGKKDAALANAERLQDAEENYINDVLSFTSEKQRLGVMVNFVADRCSPWASTGTVRPLARALLRTKGLVLDALIEERTIASQGGDSETQDLNQRIQVARQRVVGLRTALASSGSNTNLTLYWTQELARAHEEVELLERTRARQISGAGWTRRILHTTFEDLQQAIPKDTIVLEGLCYPRYLGSYQWTNHYGVLVFAHEGEPRWIQLGEANAIEHKIRLYQHAVNHPEHPDDLITTLKDLHDLIWRPIQNALTTTNIVFSPDAQFNFVSLATLLQPNGRFLGEDFSFSYVSAARDLLEDSPPPSNVGTLAIWANPDFDTTGTSHSVATNSSMANQSGTMHLLKNRRFQPLAGAAQEGERLRDEGHRPGFNQVNLYAGPAATEAQLRHTDEAEVIHLATHGFVLPEFTEKENRTSVGHPGSIAQTLRVANNPMLRSGLALASAHRTIAAWTRGESVSPDNDGILSAAEIALLNLTNTRLVVVSACDTGAGEALSGEGVLGLRRGFIHAGARNLLLTLWSIDDTQTTDFIADFYDTAHRLGSPARALSRVQGLWLGRLRREIGAPSACRIAGPFILSVRGTP